MELNNYYPLTQVYAQRYVCTPTGHVPREDELIAFMINRPSPKWAIDNSINKKYYVDRHRHPGTQVVTYKFMVFLNDEQATFWRLKFRGK